MPRQRALDRPCRQSTCGAAERRRLGRGVAKVAQHWGMREASEVTANHSNHRASLHRPSKRVQRLHTHALKCRQQRARRSSTARPLCRCFGLAFHSPHVASLPTYCRVSCEAPRRPRTQPAWCAAVGVRAQPRVGECGWRVRVRVGCLLVPRLASASGDGGVQGAAVHATRTLLALPSHAPARTRAVDDERVAREIEEPARSRA